MKYDIADLLNSWPFDPDEFIARRITAITKRGAQFGAAGRFKIRTFNDM